VSKLHFSKEIVYYFDLELIAWFDKYFKLENKLFRIPKAFIASHSLENNHFYFVKRILETRKKSKDLKTSLLIIHSIQY